MEHQLQAQNSATLPRTPEAGAGTIARLLISPSTDNQLAWSLLGKVDLSSNIDGMSMLQAFCMEHARIPVHRTALAEGEQFPASKGEPWPDPQRGGKDRWPMAATWIGAALIANSNDPFGWRTPDGRDVLDFVVDWGNDHLLAQLLRKEGAPSIKDLALRSTHGHVGRKPWIHQACSRQNGYIMLDMMLGLGMDPDQLDENGTPALHEVSELSNFRSMTKNGVDIWARDEQGRLAVQAWVERDARDPNKASKLVEIVGAWCKQAASVDIDRARRDIKPVLFYCLGKKKMDLASAICRQLDTPLLSLRDPQDGSGPLGIMASHALKSSNENTNGALFSRLGDLGVDDAEHCSYRGIPDLDLVFVAMARKDRVSIARRPSQPWEDAFMEILKGMGLDHEQARARKWEAVQRLGSMPKSRSGKINDAIESALSNHAWQLFQQAGRHLDGKPACDEAIGAVCDPRKLVMAASSKVNPRTMREFFSLAQRLVVSGQDEINAILIGHLIELAVATRGSGPCLDCLDAVVDAVGVPDTCDIQALAGVEQPAARVVLAKLVAARMASLTPQSTGAGAGPRL